MLETPQITRTAAQLTAVIQLTIPRSEIQSVMGPGFGELMSTLAAQGVAPTGPAFSHHFRMHPDTFEFEIGVPVATPIVAAGRVRPGVWPAIRVARAVLHGNYDGLASAWGEVDIWISANGLTPRSDYWESYTVGPATSPDPADWRTELSRPLAPEDVDPDEPTTT
ncbi:MAG: GyrI-like domain-containing protein [Pseudomonadota bacterium]|nr:GyrI-like domain-containing protein [Pseudomonadota bacterium]